MRLWIGRALGSALLVLIAAFAHAQPPGSPLNVTATVNPNSTLTIRWTPPQVGGVPTEYVVEISMYPDPEGRIVQYARSVPGSVTTHTTDWLRYRRYYVRVHARNADGEATSNQIAVDMPCLPPEVAAENLAWRSLGNNRVRLVWTYAAPYVDLFLYETWHPTWVVEVGTAPGLADVGFESGAVNRSATLTLPSGNYYARVRAACSVGAPGAVSADIAITSGTPDGTSPVLINELAWGAFVELKNVSSAPISIGGWKILVSAPVSEAGTLPAGTTLQPGCTYLLSPADRPLDVPADAALTKWPFDAALVTDAGQIADGVALNALSPLVEGSPLPWAATGSYTRRGGQDTNDNGTDFVYATTPTPQNSSSPCDVEPGPPSGLASSVAGNTVQLWWNAPFTGAAPTVYRLEAGSMPGTTNLAVFELPGSTRAVVFMSIPNGTYFVRVRAVSAQGISAPSNEVTVVVCGVGCTEPGAVTALAFQVSGSTVLLTWRAPTSGAAPTEYMIEAGSAPGLGNLAQFTTGSTTEFIVVTNVPPGTYYVRVRGVSGSAIGPPSNEVVIAVR
jgi:hypothetical protein